MKYSGIIFSAVFFVVGCQKKEKADYIIKDAVIYTMNKHNDVAECVAVKNGKIVEVGSNEDVLRVFTSDSIVSMKGKYVYPAFTDAHAHFFGLAYFLGDCNLYGSKSVQEILARLKIFREKNPHRLWITGRGWDQNLFEDKQFPDRDALDSVFPDIPVCLTRVDGHAVWTNTKAMEVADVFKVKRVDGGEIVMKNGKLSGIFIDNATMLIEKHIPVLSKKEIITLLMKADSICMKNQIRYVHEAGLEWWQIQLLDSIIEKGLIRTKIYAMALPTKENLEYFVRRGYIDKSHFKVKAFKIYADGALGSRGALLKQTYADKNTYGLRLILADSLRYLLNVLYQKGFQACTHAIGDSANKWILQEYAKVLKDRNDRRWRIEHAQVVDFKDMDDFGKYAIIPSVQPTHAVSDKNWAVERLGKERMLYAYSYQSLWQQNKKLALGTDFPVEEVSPLKTFFAAVFRCDYDLKDTVPFNIKEGLNRLQTLRGMTIDAAYAAFMEKETGSIEAGKNAEFTILDIDLMTIGKEELSKCILSQKN
ncbi:MAG: amidohydrolase [Bacteroidia bacterium]|nr:MAG: amidohydrolase [Bacteroidia bacterium]